MTNASETAVDVAPIGVMPNDVPAEAPAPLVRRVGELLADANADRGAVDRHIEAAERAVARLLREQCTSRAAALDLLAADALATYAFELAADDPDGIPDLAARAMARFAALAEAGEGSSIPKGR